MENRPMMPSTAVPSRRALVPMALALLLCACAMRPVIQDAPPDSPPPHRVAQNLQRHLDRQLLWGGMILEVQNFENHTEVEILAFPLDRAQRPLPTAMDQGRFIALLPGFADPAGLPPGRFVTLVGRLTGDREALLHRAPYVWPEVDVRTLHLWPPDFRERRSRISVGIGVRL